MSSDGLHARGTCKITRVLQCNLKMDPSRAGSDPNSARLGRIRPCLGRLAGANDPCWADLGVHPTRVGPIRPDKIIKHPFGFAVFFENGPDPRRIQPRFSPTWLGPTVPGSTCRYFLPVLGRFRDASNLTLVDSEGQRYPDWT